MSRLEKKEYTYTSQNILESIFDVIYVPLLNLGILNLYFTLRRAY